ncbi:FecR domain-containing protein [Gangjinia marincola]|uniref:FecR domain-containing protein n=1 Tax=Gangjinia marincola TaxID=578463 RepID=A0ABN1MFC3_9FLAO
MNTEYLVKKWLENNLTPAEQEAFDALEDAALYKEIAEEAQRFKVTDKQRVISFDRLNQRLETKKDPRTSWTGIITRIAAILVLGGLSYLAWVSFSTTTISTVVAENRTITLPDESIAHLNQNSQLSFRSYNWEEERALTFEGEAFFEVKKGKQFDVQTAQGTVSVLGTKFNVIASENTFEVTCFEGLVRVIHQKDTVQLPAGKQFKSLAGSTGTQRVATAEPYWLKNRSVFKNAPLAEVLNALEQQFEVKIEYDADQDLYFTGAFTHDTLEKALTSITAPLPIAYTIIDSTKVIISRTDE